MPGKIGPPLPGDHPLFTRGWTVFFPAAAPLTPAEPKVKRKKGPPKKKTRSSTATGS